MPQVSLQDLPEHILETIFLQLNLHELAISKRINKFFEELLTTNVAILLREELLASSLRIPPSIRQESTAASLLSLIRERRSGFRTIAPSRTFQVTADPDERRLYEYLEGTLLRGSGRMSLAPGLPHGVTLYDFKTASEWETIDSHPPTYSLAEAKRLEREPAVEEEEEEIVYVNEGEDDKDNYQRRKWTADFQIKDFTMDPGQNLFVAAQVAVNSVSRLQSSRFQLDLHLLTLSDFTPHPKAYTDASGKKGFLSGVKFGRTEVMNHLVFQICDDKVFIFTSDAWMGEIPIGEVSAWNWQTGEMIFNYQSTGIGSDYRLRPINIVEDFVLLTPDCFALAEFEITRTGPVTGTFPCSLVVYGLVPASNSGSQIQEGEELERRRLPKFEPRKVGTFELPCWKRLIMINIRSDPPPRKHMPTETPLKTYPDARTGIIVLQFECDDGLMHPEGPSPIFHLFVKKETLLDFMPHVRQYELTGQWDTKVHDISLEKLAPHCRFVSDIDRQNWVCYVYGYNFVTPRKEITLLRAMQATSETFIRLLNFNPIDVRKLMTERQQEWRKGLKSWTDWDDPVEGGARQRNRPLERRKSEGESANPHLLQGIDNRAIYLVTKEDTTADEEWLNETIVTGAEMPYMWIETGEPKHYDGVMIDDSRIIGMTDDNEDGTGSCKLEVLQFGP